MIAQAPARLRSAIRPSTQRSSRCAYWRENRRDVPIYRQTMKRILDVVIGATIFLLCAPLFAVVSAWIRLVSPGPIFFWQHRVGKGGKLFRLFKFRTMVDGAHLLHDQVTHLNQCDGPVLKIANDPRLHRIGAFLRRTSLDELPQLWNVLRGDMSLVGPRPALPAEVAHYAPHYHQRLTVTPGMTGLWQVSGRTNVPFKRWMAMDIWYVQHWSLAIDAWILLRTLPAVLRRDGAW